jgi:hypothetical protein
VNELHGDCGPPPDRGRHSFDRAAFAISHPGVTSALLGARTMEQLEDLLAGVDVVLSDDVLDRIDQIVPPGTDIDTLDQAYVPPAIQKTELRRRPLSERSVACDRRLAAAFPLPTPTWRRSAGGQPVPSGCGDGDPITAFRCVWPGGPR